MEEKPPRYIMIGGFLGAGKTTSILKLANWLTKENGLRVGLITNDQAEGLVDTALARDAKFVTEEIAGGCFCCRSASLVEATDRLTEKTKPDVFIAEPVGSCTDLIATVSVPLTKLYKKNYAIAPLSVVIDPFRALRVLGNFSTSANASFSDDINYIYRKQLEEAEIIVINKCEVISPERIETLRSILANEFPEAEVLCVSARTGMGVLAWWERLMNRSLNVKRFMEVDYGRYADGEALLGWVNGIYHLFPSGKNAPPHPSVGVFDGNAVLRELAERLRRALQSQNIEVAHLKMTIGGEDDSELASDRSQLAAIQWVRSDAEAEFTQRLDTPLTQATLVVNMRAEADPNVLRQVLEIAVRDSLDGLGVETRALQSFRPSPPQPTHRVTTIGEARAE